MFLYHSANRSWTDYLLLEHFVPMIPFAENLRRRAEELGISNAEAARRAGLSERRYAHYVSGQREPDLATLIRIAQVLGITPNELLGFNGQTPEKSPRTIMLARLEMAAKKMPEEKLQMFVVQAEAVVSA